MFIIYVGGGGGGQIRGGGAQKVSHPLRGGGGVMKVLRVVRGGGCHESMTLPVGSNFFCAFRIVTFYTEIYGPHSMNKPACKNSSIKIFKISSRSCIPPFATVWPQTTSREVSHSLVTRSLQMEWKTTHNKIKAVEHFPIPTIQRTVRQFMGLTSYLRRYVNIRGLLKFQNH